MNNEQAMLEFDQMLEERINKRIQKDIADYDNCSYAVLGLTVNTKANYCKITDKSAQILKQWIYFYLPKYRVNNVKQFVESARFVKKIFDRSIQGLRTLAFKVDDGLSKRWISKLKVAGYKVDFKGHINLANIYWK